MDNVLLVVDDLEVAKAFFIELGVELEGETTVEGPLVGRLIGLEDVWATLATVTVASSWTSSTRPILSGSDPSTRR
jgi:hypothetical protein